MNFYFVFYLHAVNRIRSNQSVIKMYSKTNKNNSKTNKNNSKTNKNNSKTNSKTNKTNGGGGGGDNHSQGSQEKKKFHGPYSSNVFHAPIVNAITGVKYPWTVGSFGEEFLWKVVNTTRFEPKLYFYDSPEQYEEYRRVKIDPEAKVEWHRLQQRLGNASTNKY